MHQFKVYIYMERDRGCKINTYIYRFRIADDIYEAPGGAEKIGHSTQLQTNCEIRYALIDCGREDPSNYKTFRSLDNFPVKSNCFKKRKKIHKKRFFV